MDVNELLKNWHDRRAEDYERFKRCFPESDDLLAIVLRGHLLVEEHIDRLNRHCLNYPEYYDQAKFNFGKKLLLAKALILVPYADRDEFFGPIERLNELRNNLAHNLESAKLKNKILEFIAAVEKERKAVEKESKIKEESEGEFTIEKRTRNAIAFILGQMVVLDIVVEFMEKSRAYGANNKE